MVLSGLRMQNKSTHGLRLDQLAELFRAAATGADPANMESLADQRTEPVPQTSLQREPDKRQERGTNGRKTGGNRAL